MIDEIYKEFFKDYQTERVLNSSEVWRNYSQAELARDEIRKVQAFEQELDTENQLMSELESFRKKVSANPELKAYLKKVAAVLREQPHLREQVDPNFLNGLDLLDFEE